MKKLSILFAALLVGVMSWGGTATVTMKGYAGNTNGTRYQSTTASTTSGDVSVGVKAYKYAPKEGTIKGNETSVSSNFSIWNTGAFSAPITKIVLSITSGTFRTGATERLFAVVGTTSQEGVTTYNASTDAGTLNSGKTSITWEFDAKDGYTFFRLLSAEKFTDGTCSGAVVTITLSDVAAQTVNSLSLNKTTLTLNEGQNETLIPTVDPTDAIIEWTTSDATVAKVANGVVTAVSKGNATITALAGDKTATCEVTVNEDASAYIFTKATNIDQLSDGDTVMIGWSGKSVLMGQWATGNKYIAPITDFVIFNGDSSKVRKIESALYVLEQNGTGWNLKGTSGDSKDKYISLNGNTDVTAVAGNTGNALLTISIAANGVATINKGNGGKLQYNTGAPRFTFYSNSGQSDVVIYYFHDPNAGKIEVDPAKVVFDNNQLESKAASGSTKVTVTGTNIKTDGMQIDLFKHEAFSITPASDLPAEGGEITIAYSVSNLEIQAADTTLRDTLLIMGTDLNSKTLSVEIPIEVKLLKEYFPVSITTVLSDSINQMGGVHMQNSTNEITGKDIFLLNEVTVVYKSSYETIVKDATGFLAVNSAIAGVAQGDVISGVRGRLMGAKRRYYFKLEDAAINKTGTATVEPEVVTGLPKAYGANYEQAQWFKYESVKFSNTSGKIVFNEGEEMTCKNSYGFSAPSDTQAPYSVEGIVSVDGKNILLLLTATPIIDPNYHRPASGVNLNKTSLTLNVGQSETLVATVKPDDAYNKNVSWSVDKPEIVKIEQDGKVTAMREGEAVITVTTEDGNFTKSCTVTVTDIATLIYRKVSNISELEEGSKVMIVSVSNSVAAGAFGTKNIAGVTVTITGDEILSTDATGATIYTLGKSGSYWTISDGDQLIGKSTDRDKELTKGATTKTINEWTISINADCDTIMSPDPDRPNRFIAYNSNNTSIFNAYTSYDNTNMHPVKLFVEAGKKLDDIEPTGVIINPSVKEIVVGSELQIDAEIVPSNSKYRDVIWESKNPGVATVSAEGLVQAVAVGEAKIVVKSDRNNDLTDTCFLTVRDSVHVASVVIKIDDNPRTKLTIREGVSKQLTAVISPDNADVKQIEWRSSDTEIATISADGLLTAVNAGTATITADSKDRGVKAELALTVTGTPRVEINKTAIAFDDVIYRGVTLTHRDSIEVVGKYLTEDINIVVSGEGFSASAQKLPKEGGKLYISYSINKGGDFTGSVSLDSEGAIGVSVTLSLHAEEELSIAKILEREPEKGNKTGTNQYLMNDVVVTYQNGNRLYVRDESGSLLITNADGTFANGTILKGIKGRIDYVKYNPEMVMSVQPTAVAGTPVDADTLLTYPVRKDISRYVILPAVKFKKDATIDATNKEAVIAFDGGNLTVYNTYEKSFAAVDTRHVYNILGTIMKYGDNYFEVSPIEITKSDEPYMYSEWTFAYFDDNELDASGKATGTEVIAFDTINIKELKIEGTSIFSATFADGKLTVSYTATQAGRFEGTVTVTGIPTKAGAANKVIVIDCDVTIAAYSDPVITVDKDEVVFDSITVKYMEHQKGSAVVNVTSQNVKSITVSNSNKDVFDAVLNNGKLTISYDVYKGGEFSTIITLKGEATVAGKKVDNVTIRARISVGQYPDEEGVENVNAEQFNGIRFNILGQRVDENYRGVVIENGQKKVIK